MKNFSKLSIITSFLFVLIGCSTQSQVSQQPLSFQDNTSSSTNITSSPSVDNPVNTTEQNTLNRIETDTIAYSEDSSESVNIPSGRYTCTDLAHRDKGYSFDLLSDGTYQRVNGETGKYSFTPDPEALEYFMTINWLSGPNLVWNNSIYSFNDNTGSVISMGSTDHNLSKKIRQTCKLVN